MLSKFLQTCLLMMSLTGCSMVSDMMPTFNSNSNSTPNPTTNPALTQNPIPIITPTIPHQIALLLPLQGDLANAGKAVQTGFNDAYEQSAIKPQIKIYDTGSQSDQNINALYNKAVQEGADYVVGPLEKSKVAVLENNENIKVITLALNNSDKPLSNPNLYEFSLSPTDEAKQVADKASKDGYSAALLITPSGSWGKNIANVFTQQWENNNGTVVGQMEVDNSVGLNPKVQSLLQTQNFDVVIMIVRPVLARQIMPVLKSYSNNIPVYSTSLVYSGLMNAGKDQDLNGLQFCDMPLVLEGQGEWAKVRQQMILTQPPVIQQYIRLYGLGWDVALLTQHFDQLKVGLSGATGNLTLDEHNDILRKLNFGTFENGIPETHL
jgi:outer membrane PBP1 activator LpoA protein